MLLARLMFECPSPPVTGEKVPKADEVECPSPSACPPFRGEKGTRLMLLAILTFECPSPPVTGEKVPKADEGDYPSASPLGVASAAAAATRAARPRNRSP